MSSGKTKQRHARLSREGFFYVTVLCFIVGGAVLREVNLLFVLAAVLMGPLFLGWRLARGSLGNLTVTRHAPRRTHAGVSVPMEIELHNGRRYSSSWLVVARDHLTTTRANPQLPPVKRVAAGEEGVAFFANLPPGASRRESYVWRPRTRGRHAWQAISLSTRFPLGLVEATAVVASSGETVVAPALGQLRRDWQRWLERVGEGAESTSQRRGMREGDYYGLREWRPGDSRRWIHWRSSARQGSLTTLQFEDQRHDDLALWIDPWIPASSTAADMERVELALSFAATLIVELTRSGRRTLRVALAGSKPQGWSTVKGTARDEILDALADLEPSTQSSLNSRPPGFQPPNQAVFGARERWIVVSTRARSAAAISADWEAGRGAAAQWIEVGSEIFSSYFDPPTILRPDQASGATTRVDESPENGRLRSPHDLESTTASAQHTSSSEDVA